MAGAIVSREIVLSALPGVLGDFSAAAASVTFDRSLKETSVYLSSQAKLNFDQGRAPDGSAWKPLKRQRSRKRDKKRNKRADGSAQGGQEVLRDTDSLMGSMVGRGRGAQYFVRNLGRMSLEQGSNRDYGIFHQMGTRNMPRREFAGVTDKMADRISQYVADDVVRQLVG